MKNHKPLDQYIPESGRGDFNKILPVPCPCCDLLAALAIAFTANQKNTGLFGSSVGYLTSAFSLIHQRSAAKFNR